MSSRAGAINRSPNFVGKMLTFIDEVESDQDGDAVSVPLSDNSHQLHSTCRRSFGTDSSRTPPPSNVRLWDSGLGSPTPRSSPSVMHTPSRNTQVGTSRRTGGRSLSPIPLLEFGDEVETTDAAVFTAVPAALSPPHRRMGSLCLYDTPHTPKSLLEKSHQQRKFLRNSLMQSTVASHVSSCTRNSGNSVSSSIEKRGKSLPESKRSVLLDPFGPQANINPFTSCRKRMRPDHDGSANDDSAFDVDDEKPFSKRLALSEINTSRYVEEFHQVCTLGDGEFGSVYQCVNRLDGCTYAIKKSKMPVAGSVYERNALNEVYAHAVLGKHTHVVRYYSAWAEDNHMYIQNEFCNGGSLGDAISSQRRTGKVMRPTDLAQILMQVALGLKYIHAQGLVHMDIKPANIFIHREVLDDGTSESGVDEDFSGDEGEESPRRQKIVYKIGDLGHVTSISSPFVEEGDCRYLPLEILQDKHDDLPKADVFSLALTVFEAGSNMDLPKNGQLWHEIREVALPDIDHISSEFNSLLKSMAVIDPKDRPSAAAIAHHAVLCPFRRKSRAQLYRELNEEKLKNQILKHELECQKLSDHTDASLRHNLPLPSFGGPSVRRLLGKTCMRSTSLTVF